MVRSPRFSAALLAVSLLLAPALDNDGEDPVLSRRIEYWNPNKQEILVFITNLPRLAALRVAAIYKDRRAIELLLTRTSQGWGAAACWRSGRGFHPRLLIAVPQLPYPEQCSQVAYSYRKGHLEGPSKGRC
jgi:hypothetical protein